MPSHMHVCGRAFEALSFLLPLLLAGCAAGGPSRAAPVDAALARQVLQQTLESWMLGHPPDALLKLSPAITVQDMDWETGSRLVAYQIIGEGKDDDANLRCPVQLTLRDKQDRETTKKVTYVVGTSPVITVFRELFP